MNCCKRAGPVFPALPLTKTKSFSSCFNSTNQQLATTYSISFRQPFWIYNILTWNCKIIIIRNICIIIRYCFSCDKSSTTKFTYPRFFCIINLNINTTLGTFRYYYWLSNPPLWKDYFSLFLISCNNWIISENPNIIIPLTIVPISGRIKLPNSNPYPCVAK